MPRWQHFDAAANVKFDHSVPSDGFRHHHAKVLGLLQSLGYAAGANQQFTPDKVMEGMDTRHEALIPGTLIRSSKPTGGGIMAVAKANFQMPQFTPDRVLSVDPVSALAIELQNLPYSPAWQMGLLDAYPKLSPQKRLELDPLTLIARAFQQEILENGVLAQDLLQFITPGGHAR